VAVERETRTPTYGRFVAEPFERGFGATVGNSLRRILLSSLEGSAVTRARIQGVQHEFTTIPGVVEDVTDICLNLKSLVVKNHSASSKTLRIEKYTRGVVRGEDVICDDQVVVIFHDHGTRYLGKMFNDEWMRERGFLEEELLTAGDLVAKHGNKPLVSLYAEELVSHAIAKMRNFDISQIPVMKDGQFVGSIDDSHVYQLLVEDPSLRDAPISTIMNPAFPVVQQNTSVEELCKLISKHVPAVLVELGNGKFHIVSRYDVIAAMA
jgi:CBS domain-containing protein